MLAFPLFSEMIVGFKTLYQLLSKVFKTFVGVVCRRCLCQKWTHFLAFVCPEWATFPMLTSRVTERPSWSNGATPPKGVLSGSGDVSTFIFTQLTWLPELQLPQITYELRMWMDMIWVLFGPYWTSSRCHSFWYLQLLPMENMAAISHLPHWLPWLPWLICTLSNDSKRPSSESAMEIPSKHQKLPICVHINIKYIYIYSQIPIYLEIPPYQKK